MDFANEAYVRLYVRDTVTWKRLQWDGQVCTMQLLRRAYPTGAIELGGIEPWEAAVQLCGASEDTARRGVAKMLELGVVSHDGDRLVFARYAEANDTAASDKQRAKEYRARQRASRNVTVESQNVMDPSRRITDRHDRHDASRTVTELGAADLSQEQLAAAGAAWLSKAMGQEPFPLTPRWVPSLVALAKKPGAQKALAARVLAQEAQKPDVLPILTPEHVHSYWHCYGAGRAPGKAIARSSEPPPPTELEKLQAQYSELSMSERACLFDENAKRERIRRRMDDVDARMKAIREASNGRPRG